MKIAVIGGTGLIGSKVVSNLGQQGHEAVPASPSTGVNSLTGEGLAEVMAGASVVIDLTNAPSFEPTAAREFFQKSTGNLLSAEAVAGVGHHVALSVVGIERLPENGYFAAKVAQEELIKKGSIPFSILRATQFFEFAHVLADAATEAGSVRVAPVAFQPIASDDVARAVTRVAVEPPTNGTAEIGGPDRFRMDEFFRDALAVWGDPRKVVTDPHARFYGSEVEERSLVPGDDAALGEIRYAEWPGRSRSGT